MNEPPTSADLWDAVAVGDPIIRAGVTLLAERVSEARKGGEGIVGWKVGWNDIAFRQKMGVSSGVVGVLFEQTTTDHGHLSLDGATRPGVEFEVAFRLGPRSAGGWTIEAVAPAIELIDVNELDPARAIGGNIWHRAAIIGDCVQPVPRSGEALTLHRTHNDGPLPAVVPAEPLLDVAAIVRFVETGADAIGEVLEEGQWVLGGNLAGRVLWVEPGDRLTATFDKLGDVAVALS